MKAKDETAGKTTSKATGKIADKTAVQNDSPSE